MWGSGVIVSYRYLSKPVREKSRGITILVVNDNMDISSALRSCGLNVKSVVSNDFHSRHEVLASITEGSVMGLIVDMGKNLTKSASGKCC